MLARLVYTEGAHAPILFVLIVVVIAYNYGITYSLGDKTAYGGEKQIVHLTWRINLADHILSAVACRYIKCSMYQMLHLLKTGT